MHNNLHVGANHEDVPVASAVVNCRLPNLSLASAFRSCAGSRCNSADGSVTQTLPRAPHHQPLSSSPPLHSSDSTDQTAGPTGGRTLAGSTLRSTRYNRRRAAETGQQQIGLTCLIHSGQRLTFESRLDYLSRAKCERFDGLESNHIHSHSIVRTNEISHNDADTATTTPIGCVRA